MASTFPELDKMKQIDPKHKKIVFGFIREAQLLLPQNTAYYNIPILINWICLGYYFQFFDKFDPKYCGPRMTVLENGTILKQSIGKKVSSCLLTKTIISPREWLSKKAIPVHSKMVFEGNRPT